MACDKDDYRTICFELVGNSWGLQYLEGDSKFCPIFLYGMELFRLLSGFSIIGVLFPCLA